MPPFHACMGRRWLKCLLPRRLWDVSVAAGWEGRRGQRHLVGEALGLGAEAIASQSAHSHSEGTSYAY